MHGANTPRIAPILAQHDLEYIPEAHCYITYGVQIIDLSFPNQKIQILPDEIIAQEEIEAEQIFHYKEDWHKNKLADWCKTQASSYNLESIWSIREACIASLSQ